MTPQPTYRASTFKRQTSPAAWQTALGKLPYAHPLQTWTWGSFKARWGWEMHPYLMTVAESSWEPLAAALVLKRKIPALPFSLLYVPKGPALDYNDRPLRQQVLAQLERIARRERAIFLKIDPEVVKAWGVEEQRPSSIGGPFIQELKQRGWRFSADQIQFRNTVEMPLDADEDAILAAMKSKTRYNIRLAGRKGITIRPGTPADFPTIINMYQETADRDDFTIRPPAYYLDAWQSFWDADMAQPLLAEYKGEPIAAVVLIRFGPRVIYMYGASTGKERNRMPNYLLQWEAIRWAKAHGAAVYDFWGAPDQFVETDSLWGVWRFKKGFHGQVVRHIGAWDYIARPFWYWVYTAILPRYLNLLRARTDT